MGLGPRAAAGAEGRHVDLEPATIGDLTRVWARRTPDHVALRDRAGTELTYAQLDDRTTRLARGLLDRGLSTGDRVATWMTDGFEYVEVYLACAKAGLVVCPVNERHTASEATYLLQDSGAALLVHAEGLSGKVADLPSSLTDGLQLVSVPAATDWRGLIVDGPVSLADVAVAPEDAAIIGYTSGTTGKPKGAILTHRSVLSIARLNATSYRLGGYPHTALTGAMSFVSVVPAHVLCTLRLGGTITIMGTWTAADLIDVLERDRITFFYVASPRIDEVCEALESAPQAWRTLRSVMHSASRARPDQLARLTGVVGPLLVEGWGMTENSGGLMTATLGHEMLDAEGGDHWSYATVGLPALDTEVRVVDGSGAELPRDGASIGELWFRSPGLFSGYWNREEATREAFRDGWFRTGDLGAVDGHGYVYVSERRTDLIVSGGANVYPSEVEDCISQLPAVAAVAVVGAEHPRWGQAVVAVVVPAPDASITTDEVVEHCRRHLAGYKKPTRVVFVEELPLTPSQKVSRASVREMVRLLPQPSGSES
jgi:acyl-CoA synthetase (AMP-forming)/AMP-acid ligase II